MKILMLKDYFYPENCAGITLTEDLIETFAKNGNEVYLYTPTPCRGISKEIRQKYKGKKIENSYNGMVNIYRYSLFTEKKSIFLRTIRYILQNIIQIYHGIRCKADIVFLGSTPPTMGFVGAILKKIKKVPFIYNIQDIFPDSLVTAGLAKEDSIIWKIGNLISNYAYAHADHLIVISNDMKENLIAKGIDPLKITVIPNWVNTDKIKRVNKQDNHLYTVLNLNLDKFNIVYAGNIGEAQNINILLEAALALKKREMIQFLIFGAGSQFKKIEEEIDSKDLFNVKIYPLRPQNEISEVYSLGDISVISCKKGAGSSAVPSKTWSILATGTPILASYDINSELAVLINENQIGIAVQADETELFIDAILEFYNHRDELDDKAIKIQEFVKQSYSNRICTNRYLKILNYFIDKESISNE